MTPEEQSRAIDELEAALDRLHALYNQYFMGIEKLEPLVSRKAVERKINLLRKEKLKSTALRFRFQTQVQKYNTHSNYWRRICRQIEEGTYKRHLLRAQKRTEEKIRETIDPDAPAALLEASDDRERDNASPVYDLGSLDEFGDDLGLDEPFGGAESRRPNPEPGGGDKPHKTKTPVSGLRLDDIDDLIAEASPKLRKRSSIPPTDSGKNESHPVETGQKKAPSSEPRAPRAPHPVPKPGQDKKELEDFFSNRPAPPPPERTPSPPSPTEVDAKSSVREDKTPTPRVPVKAKDSARQNEKGKEALDARKAQAIYRTFLAARKRTQEPTEGVSFDKVKKSLEKQYNAKSGRVDFKVVIRNGKAVIAAVPKKD